MLIKVRHAPELDYHEHVWTGRSAIRDALGRDNNNGSIRWAVVVCNNPACRFEALVDPATAAREVTPPGPRQGTRVGP